MLNPEDKKDVKNAMGKAVANKVSQATNDGGPFGTAKRHLRADRKTGSITRGGEKVLSDLKNKAIHAKSGWSASDEKAHQSDVKAGRSWNKMGRSGAKNPHM